MSVKLKKVFATAGMLLAGFSGENVEVEPKTSTADDGTGTGSDTDDGTIGIFKWQGISDGTTVSAELHSREKERVRKKLSKDTEAASPVIGVILMVSIAVLLAAAVGSFVLATGGDIGRSEGATIEFVQYSNGFTLTIVDTGDFEEARIVGPKGQASMKLDATFKPGTQIAVSKNFSNATYVDVVDNLDSSVESAAGGNLTQDEECLINHDETDVRGVEVDNSSIGCSGKHLEDAAESLGGETGFAESEIPFQLDAQYQLVTTRGSSSRAKTFEVKDLR